jgi:hypothetical protein
LVEVRTVDAVALGESHLRAGALDCGPEQLTNFIVAEHARRNPQIACDREQILPTQPEFVLSCGHAATPRANGESRIALLDRYVCGV